MENANPKKEEGEKNPPPSQTSGILGFLGEKKPPPPPPTTTLEFLLAEKKETELKEKKKKKRKRIRLALIIVGLTFFFLSLLGNNIIIFDNMGWTIQALEIAVAYTYPFTASLLFGAAHVMPEAIVIAMYAPCSNGLTTTQWGAVATEMETLLLAGYNYNATQLIQKTIPPCKDFANKNTVKKTFDKLWSLLTCYVLPTVILLSILGPLIMTL